MIRSERFHMGVVLGGEVSELGVLLGVQLRAQGGQGRGVVGGQRVLQLGQLTQEILLQGCETLRVM